MIGAAMLSLLSAQEASPTIRAREGLVFSDRFVFAPADEVGQGEPIVCEPPGAAASVRSVVVGNLALRPCETHSASHYGTALGVFASVEEPPWASFPSAFIPPSNLVNLIERVADAGNDTATLGVVEASLAHPSSAVRVAAINAMEALLPAHYHLVARLNWIRNADTSPAVRAVAGEVLDYMG